MPALDRHSLVFEIESEVAHEPVTELAERASMTHRYRAGADETLPAVAQQKSLDWPAGRIRTIEHPDRLLRLGGCLEHVAQRRHKGVHAAAEVLQIDQQHVEVLHHRGRRAA